MTPHNYNEWKQTPEGQRIYEQLRELRATLDDDIGPAVAVLAAGLADDPDDQWRATARASVAQLNGRLVERAARSSRATASVIVGISICGPAVRHGGPSVRGSLARRRPSKSCWLRYESRLRLGP